MTANYTILSGVNLSSTIVDTQDFAQDDLTVLDASGRDNAQITQSNSSPSFSAPYLGNTFPRTGDLFFLRGSEVFLLSDNVYNNGTVLNLATGSTSLAGGAASPSNDDITNATALSANSISTNTLSATAVLGEDLTVTGGSQLELGKTVWYSFTPTATGVFSFTTFGSNFDTTLQVFSRAANNDPISYSNITEIYANDDIDLAGGQNDVSRLNSKTTGTFTANQTYYIQVGGRRDDVGGVEGGNLTLSFTSGSNIAPIITGLTPTTVTAGTASALPDFQVADAESDNITVTLTATNGVINGLTDADGTAANGIQLSGLAAALNTQLAAATFTAAAAGPASIVIEASDGTSSSGQKTLSLTANAAPPVDPPGPTVTPNDQGGNTITTADSSQITEAQGTAGIDQVNYGGTGTVTLPSNIENVILTGSGNSNVTGNALGNSVAGNTGNNSVTGGVGNDTVSGGDETDLIYGNQDADLVYGNQGADVLYGGQGADTAFGGQGDDRLFGNNGNDVVAGNVGNDIVYGNQGTDIVYGNQGADILYGGQADDVLFGGQGDDILIGGLGNNTLAGGVGADRYVFGANPAARDLVLGFNQGEGDRIALSGQTYTVSSAQNGDAVLTLSGGGVVDLAGIRAEQVNAAFFA